MRLYCRLLLGLSFLTTALADVVQVNVNGMVNGTVNVFVLCTSPECGDNEGSFVWDGLGVSGTNTQLGTFTRSGQASAADPEGRFASVLVQFQQTTEATATSLALDVQTTATVDGLGGQWSVQNGDLVNQISLGFTLTTESLAHWTGSSLGRLETYQQISLNGPQGPIGMPFPGPGDYSFPLMAGQYTLEVLDDSPDFGVGPEGVNTDVVESSNFSLNADFTTIVPEPRWCALVAVSLAVLWGFLRCRRPSTHSPAPEHLA